MDMAPQGTDDPIDFSEILARLRRRSFQIILLGVLGLAVAVLGYLASNPLFPVTTSARVTFSFTEFERGQNPDGSKFQPDDLRAPEVIQDALSNLQMDVSEKSRARIRSALTIEGVIPAPVVAERDRLRATGQAVPPYFPDEYIISLTLPRDFPVATRQRELLINELVNVFRERFDRTYAEIPLSFGNAFETLKNADYFEYDLVLDEELQNIYDYLGQRIETAKMYRSPRSNFSFGDLLTQAQLFNQIHLSETLGLVSQYGLSKDSKTALLKIDYHLRMLQDEEDGASEEAKVVQDLLQKAEQRSQGYVMAIKSQASRPQEQTPVLDQSVIDSLLANDAYNFLIRKAMDAGLKVKRIETEKSKWIERRKDLQDGLANSKAAQNAEVMAQVEGSLGSLQKAYLDLVTNIRMTNEDFARQQYADAVRLSMQPYTSGKFRELGLFAFVGAFAGLLVGMALSLLRRG